MTTSVSPSSLTAAAPAVTTAPEPAKKTPRAFRDLLSLDDFERHARRRLPNMIYQYVAGGVESGQGIAGNFDAYQRFKFIPRMFRDVSGRSQATTLFGHTYQHPFGVAPLGGASFVAYQADIALAKAARQMNVPMILSASSLVRLEDVHAANADAWFQAYLAGDQPRIDRLVDRVEAAGYQTLVVTGDTPMLGNREHNIRSGFSMPIKITPKVAFESAINPRWLLGTVAQTFLRHGAPHFENTDAERGPPMMSGKVRNTNARDKLCWKNVEAIRKKWRGNLVIKGLMSPEDAFIARDLGADAVILSNHGGRQLDHTIPPLYTLAEIAASKGAMKVIIDSGIRRGTDVMKAMALGADFVFLGRPFLYASVIGGQRCVEHAMHILRDEIDRDLALIGVRTPAELDASYLRKL
ncbi:MULTISPECIES: alpha-hydroxy acid oxidase [unclassified Erwinia]|uniref:alpha-hydroxy acid oxidase n=1 Tax=unclassified Erwinia TaxID=2622719 RepID=UPI0006FA3971|nr:MULTISPECIES: alpha-hydroxy acid oxidase [unclassified Erwinia]KQN55513.1 2-hydroxy-acid oxidase [Erwinia sp. Leaf53]PLV63798.1 (S)-2-hydroxy-acid oxidase [Erwinia sp. B116]